MTSPRRLGPLSACSLLLVGLAVALSGCAGAGGSEAVASAAKVSSGGSGLLVASGHGWTDQGVEGPMPGPGTCHIRYSSSHEPLPDASCTPGAIDSAVTQASLPQTVCRKGGYTSSVRPPVSITDKAKSQIMAAYGIPASESSKYELDHLVPLADGGASDIRNLWPEPNTFASGKPSASAFVHNDKDQVEEDAFSALCAGKASLESIQKTMATDWTAGHYAGGSGTDGN
ncbi:HNH endonuclease signature motif containing protein [Sinomonas sp. P47F7]|uniref:HNH endonuclease signature motif containing protein n=1 Tax=Sinomonas sp. P47F7 TaxID=3410987 RepID=UPI003BF4E4E9